MHTITSERGRDDVQDRSRIFCRTRNKVSYLREVESHGSSLIDWRIRLASSLETPSSEVSILPHAGQYEISALSAMDGLPHGQSLSWLLIV